MTTPVRNEAGQWVIPATRRPDGTWRKEIVVKEGYVPQDEIKAYETKATRMGPPKIPGLVVAPKPAPAPPKPKVKASKPAASSVADAGDSSLSAAATSSSNSAAATAEPTATPPTNLDPKEAASKRLKALRKKLREIDELSSKATEALTAEQQAKVSKRASILSEISELEAGPASAPVETVFAVSCSIEN